MHISWYTPDFATETDEYFENPDTRLALAKYGVSFQTDQDLINFLSRGHFQIVTRDQLVSGENLTLDPLQFAAELENLSYRASFDTMENRLRSRGWLRLPAPILIDLGTHYYGFAGNRRMNLAWKYDCEILFWVA